MNGAMYEGEEINSIEIEEDSSDNVKKSSKVSSRRASQKEVEYLEREVSQLKNQLGVFEVLMDLDAFTFRVVSTRQASLHITDSLQFPSYCLQNIQDVSKYRDGDVHFNKFALDHEKLHIFSYVRVAERTSSLSEDALISVVTEIKRVIKIYENPGCV